MKKYTDMSKSAQGFSSGLYSKNNIQLTSLQSGVYVAKSLPTNVSNLSSVLKSAIDFATKNGVEIPKEATSLI